MTTLVLILLILTNLMLSGRGRTVLRIRILAAQGALLCLLPLLIHAPGMGLRSLVLVVITGTLKISLLPTLLKRAERRQAIQPDKLPDWNFSASILFGVIAVGIAMWLGTSVIKLPETTPGAEFTLFVPAALSTIFIGLTLMIAERQMLSQLMGYLVLGNGIYVLGIVLSQSDPLLIELGVVAEALVISLLLYKR